MDRYKEELKNLVEWLRAYTNSPITGAASKKHVSALNKLLNKAGLKKASPEQLWAYMTEVDNLLADIFSEAEGFDRMYSQESWYSADEAVSVLKISEPQRFADISKLGYWPLFSKYDMQRTRDIFDRQVRGDNQITVFHSAAKVLINSMSGLNNESIKQSVLELYIKLRDIEGPKPVLLMNLSYHLSDMYRTKEIGWEEAPKYLRRLNIVRQHIVNVLSDYGITFSDHAFQLEGLPEKDIDVPYLEMYLLRYIEAIREIYVRMVFARLQRMM